VLDTRREQSSITRLICSIQASSQNPGAGGRQNSDQIVSGQ
jgi:hypothetical protein